MPLGRRGISARKTSKKSKVKKGCRKNVRGHLPPAKSPRDRNTNGIRKAIIGAKDAIAFVPSFLFFLSSDFPPRRKDGRALLSFSLLYKLFEDMDLPGNPLPMPLS